MLARLFLRCLLQYLIVTTLDPTWSRLKFSSNQDNVTVATSPSIPSPVVVRPLSRFSKPRIIMPPKRIYEKPSRRAPKGALASTYEALTSADNAAVVRSIALFGVSIVYPGRWAPKRSDDADNWVCRLLLLSCRAPGARFCCLRKPSNEPTMIPQMFRSSRLIPGRQ